MVKIYNYKNKFFCEMFVQCTFCKKELLEGQSFINVVEWQLIGKKMLGEPIISNGCMECVQTGKAGFTGSKANVEMKNVIKCFQKPFGSKPVFITPPMSGTSRSNLTVYEVAERSLQGETVIDKTKYSFKNSMIDQDAKDPQFLLEERERYYKEIENNLLEEKK